MVPPAARRGSHDSHASPSVKRELKSSSLPYASTYAPPVQATVQTPRTSPNNMEESLLQALYKEIADLATKAREQSWSFNKVEHELKWLADSASIYQSAVHLRAAKSSYNPMKQGSPPPDLSSVRPQRSPPPRRHLSPYESPYKPMTPRDLPPARQNRQELSQRPLSQRPRLNSSFDDEQVPRSYTRRAERLNRHPSPYKSPYNRMTPQYSYAYDDSSDDELPRSPSPPRVRQPVRSPSVTSDPSSASSAIQYSVQSDDETGYSVTSETTARKHFGSPSQASVSRQNSVQSDDDAGSTVVSEASPDRAGHLSVDVDSWFNSANDYGQARPPSSIASQKSIQSDDSAGDSAPSEASADEVDDDDVDPYDYDVDSDGYIID